MYVCVEVHMWRAEDRDVGSGLSFHLYMGSRD